MKEPWNPELNRWKREAIRVNTQTFFLLCLSSWLHVQHMGVPTHLEGRKAHDVKGWHYIPRDEVNKDLPNRWIILIKREPPYPRDENFAVCGLHFEDECFIRENS